ncbi:PIN domain-containing protein [Arcicella sp. LKC2W]|uniref:PIN domain-containing protein n=1 Tax=Arcicella sp. LKC2W TaxID=2984198 RepID=UPI002B1F2529|nr:PIN domain-containing protein [Arcicella sp. LKC2W]MEA5461344.1 PIN domain-containing protein [Arcicella sp. LKC2W]
MKVVIDTSVIMSALMSSKGRVADVLMNPMNDFEKFSCYFMQVEIFKHKQRILKYSKLEESELLEIVYLTLKKLSLVNENQISSEHWQIADKLTKDVDSKDIAFVALSLELNATLWTLDKKLQEHLIEKGFTNVVNTYELEQLFHSR